MYSLSLDVQNRSCLGNISYKPGTYARGIESKTPCGREAARAAVALLYPRGDALSVVVSPSCLSLPFKLRLFPRLHVSCRLLLPMPSACHRIYGFFFRQDSEDLSMLRLLEWPMRYWPLTMSFTIECLF